MTRQCFDGGIKPGLNRAHFQEGREKQLDPRSQNFTLKLNNIQASSQQKLADQTTMAIQAIAVQPSLETVRQVLS